MTPSGVPSIPPQTTRIPSSFLLQQRFTNNRLFLQILNSYIKSSCIRQVNGTKKCESTQSTKKMKSKVSLVCRNSDRRPASSLVISMIPIPYLTLAAAIPRGLASAASVHDLAMLFQHPARVTFNFVLIQFLVQCWNV